MRLSAALFLAVPFSALVLAPARDAAACGGCFHNDVQQMENTQVSGHRMIFSISKTQTTLWDQIQYVGAPSSFAWVLPIKGVVNVGLSSDALFGNLDAETKVTVNSPLITCPPPPPCSNGSAGAGGTFDGGVPGGVVVTAQEVVGPYETVQLSSADPAAPPSGPRSPRGRRAKRSRATPLGRGSRPGRESAGPSFHVLEPPSK